MRLPRGQQLLPFRALPVHFLYLLAHLHETSARVAFLLAPLARVRRALGVLAEVGEFQFRALHLLLDFGAQLRRLLHGGLQALQRLRRHRLGPTRVDFL